MVSLIKHIFGNPIWWKHYNYIQSKRYEKWQTTWSNHSINQDSAHWPILDSRCLCQGVVILFESRIAKTNAILQCILLRTTCRRPRNSARRMKATFYISLWLKKKTMKVISFHLWILQSATKHRMIYLKKWYTIINIII